MTTKRRGFFDRHMKLRIVLQIFLDVLPMLLFAVGFSAVREVMTTRWYYGMDTSMITAGLLVFAVGTVPAFILSVCMAKNLPEFDIWPFWGKVSLVLRCISSIPLILAILMDLAILATLLDLIWYIAIL